MKDITFDKFSNIMKKTYSFLTVLITFFAQSQIVNFPDANFKAKLLQASSTNFIASSQTPVYNAGNWYVTSYNDIDTNDDGEIQVSEAQAIKWLNINTSNISNFTGIEFFTNLQNLNCSNNQLTSLDVSGLTNLIIFSCVQNQLSSLNVSNLTNLQQLDCYNNQLTSLNVLGLTNLLFLSCNDNQLPSLNVSSLTNLISLDCYNNQLPNLNILGLANLKRLDCSSNQLPSLNILGLTHLQRLDCYNNQLTSLNVSGLTSLSFLSCSNNQLPSLNVSSLTNLQYLYCKHNQLTSLFLKNNNSSWEVLNFSENPNLQYICADEEDLSLVQSIINEYSIAFTCHVNSYCSFTPGGTYHTINGTTRLDSTNNGCDDSDGVYQNLKINISNGTQTGSFIASGIGNYSIPVGLGTHTLTPILENPSYFNITPTTATIVFPTQASPFTQNFCVTPNGVHHDVEVTVIPIDVARPGFDALYKIIYKNKGNQVENGTVTFGFENQDALDVVSTLPVFTSESNDGYSRTLTWNYSNLLPFESREIQVKLNLNSPMETPALNAGNTISIYGVVTPLINDENSIDNEVGLRQLVVNSYDPNDKTCLEGAVIDPSKIGGYLHYQIRFENTGTYPAQNIVVKDMIDTTKFDVSSLQVINSSHTCYTKITGNKVEFIFENINLPFEDATNDGYVVFKIKSLPTLAVNSSVSNSAGIYFDYNFPIITNTATSTYQLLNASSFVFENEFVLYPNPVKDNFTIKTKNSLEMQSLQIYNTLGQIVLAIPRFSENVDVSSLQRGTYLVKVNTEKGSSGVTIIKE
ncbi:T9SS type A sorting domain-containing protein [Flavobacterium sp.]|uniref:DUF7619 domain-containing protein n=1 Tax=Flavobacterium sp. TaxID=239 RepID=UPI00333FCADC